MEILTAFGSRHHRDLIRTICDRLTTSGFCVLAPPMHLMDRLTAGAEAEATTLMWRGAVLAHFGRIAKADLCLVVNPNGDLGVGSTLELGCAVALDKLLIALQHDREPARDALYDVVLGTDDVDEVVERLTSLLTGGHLQR